MERDTERQRHLSRERRRDTPTENEIGAQRDKIGETGQ